MSMAIGVQLTTHCNLNCTHCFVDCSGNDISMEAMEKIISFAKASNSSCLAFTGGEPTMHPRFPEIMETLAKNGLKFTMITNGWNFADFYQTIKHYLRNIEIIFFSLDGATEEIHDLIRAKGSYRKILQAISICRCKEIPFGLRMTVTQRNIHQLEEMVLLAAKVGSESIAFLPLQPTPRMAALNLLLHPDDLNKIREEASRLQKIFKIKIILTAGYFDQNPLALCRTLALKSLFITSTGEVSFCCHLTGYKGGERETDLVGNLEEMSLSEASQRIVDAVASYKNDKVLGFGEGKLSKLDYFPCWHCLKYFRKVDWMTEFPGNPWSKDLLEAQFRNSRRCLPFLKQNERLTQQEGGNK